MRAVARTLRVRFPTASLNQPIRFLSTKERHKTSIAVKYPTMVDAESMPREYCEMPHDVLLTMASHGDHGACGERLIREIMAVDNLDWNEASKKFQTVERALPSVFLGTLPYKVGAVGGILVGVATIPLCFDLSTAIWFNEAFVTTEVPDDEDLETWLEVGSWTWNWMEPPLGQLSFLLLCIQFAMAEIKSVSPYSALLQRQRASNLRSQFPEYNSDIVNQYATTAPFN